MIIRRLVLIPSVRLPQNNSPGRDRTYTPTIISCVHCHYATGLYNQVLLLGYLKIKNASSSQIL